MSDEIEGCGDNGCVVAKPRGMATNARCRCDEQTLRRALQRERRIAGAWKALALARGKVLAAYRLGGRPSGKALDAAIAAREALKAEGLDPDASP